ncbi:MAG: argininosuccinate synthase [Dethiobacter sp.]|jgi:argininosuccinate synthase|nr:MAG: argininosuccinate synthase [Dethiobacter sp.]
MSKVVLAYSGGLDTSIIVKWLKEEYGYEVIAFAADVGQGPGELEGLEEKALATGASKVYIQDLRKEFVEEFAFPMLKSGAFYEKKYLLGTAIARPLIARAMVQVALEEGAGAVAHGATGKGNDQVRFELTVKALAPQLKIIAPWRSWKIRSRRDAIEYARKYNIPVPVTVEKPYSMDRNLWHISYEGGILEDPAREPLEDMFLLTRSPEQAPDKPATVEISFEKGIPVALNGTPTDSVTLLESLNQIAGENAIGRVDIVENRLVGMKSRGVYETPGGTLLYFAHSELEQLTLDRETMRYKEAVAIKYGEIIYYGLWYSPLRRALDAFIQSTQENVTGEIKLKLYRGNISVVSRRSPCSLYHPDLATFEEDELYNQADAGGFINLFGLPLQVEGLLRGTWKNEVERKK